MRILILLLFCLILLVPSQSIDIYVDLVSSSLGSGTPDDPFKSLDQALTLLDSSKTKEKSAAIFLKRAENFQYTAQELAPVYKGVNGTVIESLTISAWDTSAILKSEEDCLNLPTINGSVLGWKFGNLASVKFIGLNIIDFSGQIVIDTTKEITIKGSCFKNSRSGTEDVLSLDLWNNNQLLIEDTFLIVDTTMTKFIGFINNEADSRASQVSLKNTSVVVSGANASSQTVIPCFDFAITEMKNLNVLNPPRFINWKSEQALYIEDIRVKLIGDNQTLPFIGSFSGFNRIDINGFSVENQNFSMAQEGSAAVFQFLDNIEINIERVLFTNNTMHGELNNKRSLSLFTAENNNVLNFKDVDISNNSFLKTEESLFRFVNMQQIYAFEMKDSVIKSNRFEGKANVLNFLPPTLGQIETLKINNITVQNNTNKGDDFDFLTVDSVFLIQFNLTDFRFIDNNLTGSIFYFDKLKDQVNLNKRLNFTNVMISNCKSDDLTLLYLYAAPQTTDLAPSLQWTTVTLTNLSVLNSTFHGKHSLDWQDQDTLLEVLNAKLYVESSRVTGNTFDSFDFIVMKSRTSSVFLVSSNFDNNNFTKATIVITKFDQVFPLECELCSYYYKSFLLQYRFVYVLGSNFTNLKVHKAPLFMMNTPYIIMANNTFEHVELAETELIVTGKFYPQTCGIKEFTFRRVTDTEKKAFDDLNPRLLKIFQEAMDGQKLTAKYFYMIASNKFENLSLLDKGIILLKEYNFNEGGITVFGNSFTKIMAMYTTINLVQTAGQILNFNFMGNAVETIHYARSILRFSEFVNNTMLMIFNNSIQNYQGYSGFMVAGTNLNATRILLNNVTSSYFTNSIINIEVTENQGIQTWYQNNFTGNYLNAVDKSLWDVPDSSKLIRPMNPMKISKTTDSFIILNIERNEGNISFTGNIMRDNVVRKIDSSYYHKLSFLLISIQGSQKHSPVVIDGFQFLNNTYLNSEDYSFMKELNGLFSILVGNSWFIMSNSRFEDTAMTSKGNSLFYIAANKTSILGNTYKNITTHNENYIFDLMTIEANIDKNTFQDLDLTRVGVFLINQTSPREGVDYTVKIFFTFNHFERCKIFGRETVLQGNVLTFMSKSLNLYAESNTIIDSFGEKPVFYFSDTKCSPCVFKNNSFISKNRDSLQSLLYQTTRCSGVLQIIDSHISPQNPYISHIDFLLNIRESPLLSASIIGLDYVKQENTHDTLILAKLNSGTLEVKDLEIKDVHYHASQKMIQVFGDAGNTAPVSLYVSNMTAKNLSFTPHDGDDFWGLINFDSDGGALKYPLNFFMEKSMFTNITGISAVSLTVPKMDVVSIENCIFEKIQSPAGPAISSKTKHSENQPLKIADCNFIETKADKVGGAIYMEPTNYSIIRNTFADNKAQKVGGAIFMGAQAVSESLMKTNTFVRSSAQFGEIIGSSINSIKLEFNFTGDMGQYLERRNEKMIIRNASSRGIELTSLNITFIDFNGQRTMDLNSHVPFLALNFGGRTESQLTTTECTDQGCFIREFNMILSGEANEIINVDVKYESAILFPLTNNWKTSFAIELRGCVNGEHYNENTITCDYCTKGTYSMSPSFPCQDCPLNANCSGGNSVLPKTGFWKSESETVVAASLFECRQDGVMRCEGGSKGCANGFAGAKCQQCDFENGYVESGLLNCKKCKDYWHSLLLSGGGMLLYLIYKAVCIGKMYTTNEIFAKSRTNNGKKFYEACEKGYYVKILMVYTQVLSLIFMFNAEVKGTMASLLQIGNPSEFILVNLQCSMRALGIDPQSFIYASVSILLVSPVIQILLIIIIALIFVKSFFPSLKMSQFTRLTIVYITLLEQPGIIGNLTSFLSCSHDEITGGDYITLHPNWSCNDPRYLFFKKFLAVPFLAFWAVVIPLFMFFSLYFRRKNLEQLEVRGTWGALYNLAKTSHYYWGTVVMILSLSISYISYTFQEDPKTSAFTVFILLFTYQLSVRVVKPFRFATFNLIESLTFNLLMLSVILGYFANDIHERSLKLIAYGILAVLNAAMLVFLGIKVFDLVAMRYIQKLRNKFRKWFGYKKEESDEAEEAGEEEEEEESNYVKLPEAKSS